LDWSRYDSKQLLAAYCSLMAELRERGVVRSSNNPIADYTENLVSRSLGLALEGLSKAGYDALGSDGIRYQIKGRRLTPHNKSTQLGTIRNLGLRPFDVLAAVVYSADLSVLYGALIPVDVVAELSRFSKHSNGHIFTFRRSVLDDVRVEDITPSLSSF
jgi:hypothetical protein